MRLFYKSHGKHCHLRSFQTSCPRCGEDVLYWECTHGSKVFFQYPPYGKLIRHICRKYKEKVKNHYPVIVKSPEKLMEKSSPSCPTCGRLFKTEKDLESHLKQSRKNDPLHRQYYKNKIIIEDNSMRKRFSRIKIHYEPKFGAINIKEKKQIEKYQ